MPAGKEEGSSECWVTNEDSIEAVVLAGTELPLLLRDSVSPGVEFLDTTVIHVEAIVDE
jgi:aspartate/glutamate racemase